MTTTEQDERYGLHRNKGKLLNDQMIICINSMSSSVSLVAQLVKNLPSMRETWIRSLGWEDPLEKEKATRSSILAWRIPWTEEPHGL